MTRLESEEFHQKLVDAINTKKFAEEAVWFDGSILLDDGYGQVWLKVYRGKVIDHLPFTPPLGYTFKISGPRGPWDELVDGAKFTDLALAGLRRYNGLDTVVDGANLTPAPISIEGNSMEAFRIIEAIYLIAAAYAATATAERTAA